MFLTGWRFITMVLAALDMGMAFSHVLEMPAKVRVDGPLWLTFQQTLYRAFGTVGAVIEIGAIFMSAVLPFLMHGQQPGSRLALAGAACLGTAFVVWLGFVNPVNGRVRRWTAQSIPGDWERWRAQWEYAHTTRFVLQLLGFSLLLLSGS